MRREDIFVGMRVVCVKPFAGYKTLVGKTGTVVSTTGGSIGVEFDEIFPGGHDCSGRARDGFGRYGQPDALEEYVDTPKDFNIEMSFDELLN